MGVPLRIAEIISSPHFLEGNALYLRLRRPLVLSVKRQKGVTVVQGVVDLAERREVSLAISHDGSLARAACSLHGEGETLCPDIVAVALRYNELVITESPPVAQLADLAREWKHQRGDAPIPVRITREGQIEFLEQAQWERSAVGSLFASLDRKRRLMFLGIAPQCFTFNGTWVRRGGLPMEVRYRREGDHLQFSLPEHLFFDAASGLVFDREEVTALLLAPDDSAFLVRLLAFSVPYRDEAAFFAALSRLSETVKAVFRISGHLDGHHEVVSDAPVVFSFDIEKGQVVLDIFVLRGDRRVAVLLHRDEADQVYADGDNLFVLSPDLVRRLRQTVRTAGFKTVKGRVTAPLSHLGTLLADDSPLREAGTV